MTSTIEMAGVRSGAPEAVSYRFRLTPRPIVIDADGFPVASSHVVEITFPGDTIETKLGPTSTIIRPGTAKIIVGETTIRGVPLC